MGEVGEEAQDDQDVGPHEDALEHLRRRPSPNRPESASETGDQLAGHSFRPSAIRDACQSSSVVTMPAISARIRSASPRWLPSKRAGRWTLRISDRADHAGQHEHGEDVDEQREPALVAEPRQRRVAVDRPDHRDHDRREEDEEAPEDRRVDQAGDEPLEQLALAEDDLGLVAHPPGHVVEAVRRLAHPHQPDEQLGAAREEEAADRERGSQRERAGATSMTPRAFLSSAVIAGTISVRSPITA